MKKYLVCLLIALHLFAITGCNALIDGSDDIAESTVSNLFEQTVEEADPTDLSSEETLPTVQNVSQIMSWSLPEYSLDDVGHYVSCDGGEMHLPYSFEYTGDALSKYGVAIMLFLDGQLQPFSTDKDSTQRYVHVIYPPESNTTETAWLDLIFTPVVGSQGDVMDLTIFSKQHVDWYWGSEDVGFSGYASSITTRLKYTETPPDTQRPETKSRVLAWDCRYVDATLEEYQAWSGNSYANLSSCLHISGEGYTWMNKSSDQWNRYSFTVTPDVPMNLTIELINTTGVAYGIVIFVDGEPISTDSQDVIFVESVSGQKAIINVQVDMTDFDSQSKVYAVIIPRNYLATNGYTSAAVVDVVDTYEYYLFSGTTLPECVSH